LAGLLSIASGSALRAGTVGGPKGVNESICAYDTITYKAYFYANETAMVGVIGDGDTDLDLYVFDERGNLIVSDDDYSDRCMVTWTPRWTGQFTIKVVNRGSVYNNFRLRTN